MDDTTKNFFETIQSEDRDAQGSAFNALMKATETPVDWAYEVWDNLVKMLRHKGNRHRSIAAQLLCNLAKSDTEQRILNDFNALVEVTRDAMFVTARHTLQAIWRIGLTGGEQKQMVVDGLTARFEDCINEKNSTLIRYDIIESFRKLYDGTLDESIKKKSLELIETEADLKYRKKYGTVWKTKTSKVG